MTELWTLEETQAQALADAGDVDTGSAWDGRTIIAVYDDLVAQHGQQVGRELTEQIHENRLYWLSLNGNGKVSA